MEHLAARRPWQQDAGRCLNKPDFFALRLSGAVPAPRALLLVAREYCHSACGRALQIRFAFAPHFFPPRQVPPRLHSASPLQDASHPRRPGELGQVLRALREDALAVLRGWLIAFQNPQVED